MTPKHQALIGRTLQAVSERAQMMERVLRPLPGEGVPGQEEATENVSLQRRQLASLRASPLGQKLRWIAEDVEGYPAAMEPERKPQWVWRCWWCSIS